MKSSNKTTIKDLLRAIERGRKDYGEDFLNWQFALEQHPDWRLCSNCNKKADRVEYIDEMSWNPSKNEYDKTLFLKSHSIGCNTYFKKLKTFGIQIHY